MIKPERLKKGDTVAVVSLSRGMLGEKDYIHKYYLAKERLKKDYGLNLTAMENALKGVDYLYNHPEKRAEDLMNAFRDKNIKAVVCATGGDDTIRLLPYIDFEVIRKNPKIFTGFSDTTTNHFMMYKAGLISYYGGALMQNFAEYVKINDYTRQMIENTLIYPKDTVEITSSPYYYDDEDERIMWKEENINVLKPYHKEEIGYEILQGSGSVEGELLGGCIDVFPQIVGTSIWPSLSEWKGKVLFIETSEEDISTDWLTWLLRNLYAQGIFDVIKGIVFAKPARRSRYESYKEVLKKVISGEAKRPDLPILCNVNFGHAEPTGIIPMGVKVRLDADRKTLTLIEKATT